MCFVVWQVFDKLYAKWLAVPHLLQFLPQFMHLDDQLFDLGNLWVELAQPEQVICLDVPCLLCCWDVLLCSAEDSGPSCSLSWSRTAVSKASPCEMNNSRVRKRLPFTKMSICKVWLVRPQINLLLIPIDERSCWQFEHVN